MEIPSNHITETLIHVLHLEDDPADAQLVQATLYEAGLACQITRARTRDEFEIGLGDGGTDIILADLRLPTYDGMSALGLAHERCPEIPFIFVSGTKGEEAAIEALTQGATDYVLKHNLARLASAVQRALKASEARYIDLYDNAPDMYLSAHAQTASITNCNQTLADALGYPKAEIIGRSVFHIYHPDCLDQVKQTRSEFLAKGEIHDQELQLRKKDGSKLDVSLSASALRAKDGAVVSSREILRDITERRRNSMINAARIRLMQFAVTHCLDELLEETINEAEKVTDSRIGFYHSVDDDQQSLTFQNWSTRTKAQFCQARGKGLHYPIAQAGVWADCVLQRKPVVHNDYISLIHRKGLPEGHAAVVRELVVPVQRGEKIKAILGVGNKPADYSQKDVEALSLMADLVWEITERKQAETALAAREYEFRTLAENLPDKIVRYDREGRAVYINPLLEKTLGVAAADRIGKRIREFHPDGSYDALAQAVDNTLASGENGEIENRILVPGKEPIIYQIRTIAECDEHGEVTGVLAIGRDITERKRAEQARQANLKFFESMDRVNRAIQGAGDPEEMMRAVLDIVLSTFDGDRAFLMYPCDPGAQSWTSPMERNKPEYPGVRDLNMAVPMDPQVAETLRILLGADGPVAFGPGTPHALPEDVSKQFGVNSVMAMAIYPKTGSPWQFGIHQCADVRVWTTEEMRLFEAIGRRLADGLSSLLSYRDLRKSEEFLDKVVEHIPNMIFVKDAQTLEFIRFNRAGEQLLGYSREELIGKSDCDFFPKEEADFFTARDREVLNTKALVDIAEETILNRSNEERILHTQKLPILDDAGNPQFLLGISEDITERKKLEAQLGQSQKMEAVGQLAGGVAHDFNNMLGVIIGYAELALGKAALDDSLRNNLEGIREAALRSADITRQLLAFARRQTIAPKILDLNETVEGMLKLLLRLIGEDIDLAWLPGTKLWPVKIDPSQVDQILANLCVNARDAINGVGKVTIETHKVEFDDAYCVDHTGFHPGEFVMLALSDSGSGMDKPTMDKLFEPFFTTKGVGQGTGLGLATVYGIVKQNAGFINVYSEPGHGSTFKVYLPRHADMAGQEPKASPEPQALRGCETILVVEDEASYLKISKLILESYGYRVLTASTPGKALLMAKAHTGGIHLLLTDLIVPEMNGRDLAKKMVSLYPDIACLFMSGYTGDAIVHHGVLDEGTHFLQKPFSKQALAAKVREVLDAK